MRGNSKGTPSPQSSPAKAGEGDVSHFYSEKINKLTATVDLSTEPAVPGLRAGLSGVSLGNGSIQSQVPSESHCGGSFPLSRHEELGNPRASIIFLGTPSFFFVYCVYSSMARHQNSLTGERGDRIGWPTAIRMAISPNGSKVPKCAGSWRAGTHMKAIFR